MAQFWIKGEDLAPLKDKTVVLTGGSSGIGLATVKVLLDAGAKVVAGDLNEAPVTHENFTFVKTDVISWANLKGLFNTAVTKHGRIDHVFSNAGIGPKATYLEDKYDESGELEEPTTTTYDINLRGMINTSYLGLHYFRKQDPQGGSIVCTASASSFQQFSAWDYTTTKHGVLGWMRGAIPSLKEQNLPIRVNCVGPSWTLTGLVPKEMCEEADIETQTPDVVGRQVALLMADENRNGQFIYSAGGRNYEVEQTYLLPCAIQVVGGAGKLEQLAFDRLKHTMAKYEAAATEGASH